VQCSPPQAALRGGLLRLWHPSAAWARRAKSTMPSAWAGGEKPHQGLPGRNPALYQGPTVCNSTTALGLRGQAELNRVGSCSTGKERDTESGNDYFGARYYASTMGRFLTPDWSAKVEPVPYAKLDNPQSLNLYAYVGNNPLGRMDPDGHYTCQATKTQCAQVSSALKLLQTVAKSDKLSSNERSELQKVLKFYGSSTDVNGVVVKFDPSLPKPVSGNEDTQSTQVGNTSIAVSTITFNPSHISATSGRISDMEHVIHEGTHGVDDRKLGRDPKTRDEYLSTERHAYGNESLVSRGYGVQSPNGVTAATIEPMAQRSTEEDCRGQGGCN
jgi:RHS repeat-associated protein